MALKHNGFTNTGSYAADSCKAKTNTLFSSRKVFTGLVNIWRKNLDALMTASAYVVNNLIRLAHVRGKNCCHKLMWIMRFNPCGLHNKNCIASRVRLVECIRCKLKNIVPNAFCNRTIKSITNCAVFPVSLHGLISTVIPVLDNFLHEFDLLFCYCFSDLIRLACGKTRHLHRNLHNLLLVDHGSVGFFQDIVKTWIVVFDFFSTVHTVDIAGNHTCVKRTRTIQGDKCDDVLIFCWPHTLNGCSHTCRLNLENTSSSAFSKKSINFWISKRNVIYIDINTVVILHVFDCTGNNR